jgi:hypothetical protein
MIDVRLVPCGFAAKAIRVSGLGFAEGASCDFGPCFIFAFRCGVPRLSYARATRLP